MNEIRPYEQLIAAKLDHLPVPDMADSIWSDIEHELDAPAGPPDKPVAAFTRAGWFGLAAAVVVAALLWWYFSHEVPASPNALPRTHAPAPVAPPPAQDSIRSDKPVKKKISPVLPAQVKKDSAVHRDEQVDSVRADSVVRQILPPKAPDSIKRNMPALPDADLYAVPPVPSPGGKKHKGVKGISEDDYKISAGRDSVRKKN